MIKQTMPMYEVDIISHYDQFRELKSDWNRLASNDPNIYPFICFEWFDIWFRAFNKTKSIHTYVLRNAAGICAILPLIRSHRILFGIPIKILNLAVNDHSHKIEIISNKKDIHGYIERFLDVLLRENVSIIYLEDWSTESESFEYINRYLEKNNYKGIYGRKYIRESVVMEMGGDWDDFKHHLPKRFRKNIQNQRNKLERAGQVEIVKYSKPNDLPSAFESIQRISSRSWQGEKGTGLFSNDETKAFYIGLADFAAKEGWLSIWVLYLNGSPIAYEYHLTIGPNEYALKAEYDQEYSQLSPGAVLDVHIVKALCDGLIKKYDLLGYKDFYKTRWSGKCERYIRIFIFKNNAIGRVYYFVNFPLRNWMSKNIFFRTAKNLVKRKKTNFQ